MFRVSNISNKRKNKYNNTANSMSKKPAAASSSAPTSSVSSLISAIAVIAATAAIVAAVAAMVTYVCKAKELYMTETASAGHSEHSEQEGTELPVIMYHSILKDEASWGDYVISPEMLRSDLEYLVENGYSFVLPSELAGYVREGKALPSKPVMLTFDDGCYNFLTYAVPILRTYNAKAVVSVVGSFAEKETGSKQNPAYSYLNYEQIRELSDCGYIEIASHSYNMHSLNVRRGSMKMDSETELQYQSVFISDLLLSIDALEKNCEITPACYCYPYGLVSRKSLKYVKACRFTVSLGCEEKKNIITSDPESLYLLGRFNRTSSVTTEEFMSRVL